MAFVTAPTTLVCRWVPDYVSQISFFCGHSEECNLLESEELYGKAIQVRSTNTA